MEVVEVPRSSIALIRPCSFSLPPGLASVIDWFRPSHSHPPEMDDLQMLSWCGVMQCPAALILCIDVGLNSTTSSLTTSKCPLDAGWSLVAVIPGIDIRVGFDEKLCDLQIATTR